MTRNRLARPADVRRYSVRRDASGKWIVCPASQGVAFPAMTRPQAQREADWRNAEEARRGRPLGR